MAVRWLGFRQPGCFYHFTTAATLEHFYTLFLPAACGGRAIFTKLWVYFAPNMPLLPFFAALRAAEELLPFYGNFAVNALLPFYSQTAQLLPYPDPMIGG